MQALICDHGVRFEPEYPEPQLLPGEALIKLRLGGICNTDLELVRGYMGFHGVLGHEFVGEVIETSDARWLGTRVVGDINASCYACETCLSGRHTHCPARTTLGISGRDGAFSEVFALPQANLFRVPDSVSDSKAVFVEPLAAACQMLEQVAFHPSDRVLVIGDGKLGLLAAAVLRLTGSDLTLVGRHQAKLAIGRMWGVRSLLESELDERLRADVVVECTGSEAGLTSGLRRLRPRGTLVLKSTYHTRPMVDMSAIVVNEITLVGSRCGPFPAALRLLEAGLVDPTPLISASFPIRCGEQAFSKAATRGVLKVLLHPQDARSGNAQGAP